MKEAVRTEKTPSYNSMGGALIAALLLVAVSAIMGATILIATSTDLQISGNYRRAIQSLYAAEAGIAESMTRLVGSPFSNPAYLGDSSPTVQPNWAAYMLSNPHWKQSDDTTYSSSLTNYVPLDGNFNNTVIVNNSVQTALSYWTKVRHKTEFDAEQAGHSPLTPHYYDTDGITTLHSKSNPGNIVFHGFASGDEPKPTAFTTGNPTPYNPIEIIISQSEMEGAIALIQVEVAHPSGPPLLAPVYAKNVFAFTGGTAVIQGFDNCGLLAEGRPPVSLGPMGTLVGTPAFTGNPPTPQVGLENLDLMEILEDLRLGAQVMSEDLISVSVGSPVNPVALYAEPISGGVPGVVTLQNTNGFGILLVKGNVNISAPFHWTGLIIISGQVIFQGGLGSSVIQGALFTDQVQILSGEVTITLDTCPIAASLRVLPVTILNWQQLL